MHRQEKEVAAVKRTRSYPEQSYCGCCGREIAGGLFCSDCCEHLLSSRLPAEERTYFAQFGAPCPLALDAEEEE